MTDKIKSCTEMDKDELVYAVAILLSCQDMPEQINKLDKKCLYRLFDGFQDRGQNFAVLEDKLRDSERREMALQTEVAMLKRKVSLLEKPRKPHNPCGRKQKTAYHALVGQHTHTDIGAKLAKELAKLEK